MEVLVDELEWYFSPMKIINHDNQSWIPNMHPRHNLPQACRGRKSACLVCICSTDNYKEKVRKSSRIGFFFDSIITSKKVKNQQCFNQNWNTNEKTYK